jgi:hypothetical protein
LTGVVGSFYSGGVDEVLWRDGREDATTMQDGGSIDQSDPNFKLISLGISSISAKPLIK